MSAASPYRGRTFALLTQHGKEKLLAPILEPGLGGRLMHVCGFDTDRLGTFSREIPRTGTQRQAARTKARLGMAQAGTPLGLGSEGAFGFDPVGGILPWNVEHVLWVDDEHGLEVLGCAQGPGCHAHRRAATWDEVHRFAEQVGFPGQWLVLRPDHADHPQPSKDLADWDSLSARFQELRARSATGQVFIETDGRAHANPTRRAMIVRAAEDLVARLVARCPACKAPGFGRVEPVPGLPCSECGSPTLKPRADRFGCVRCPHRELRERETRMLADPQNCPLCNP